MKLADLILEENADRLIEILNKKYSGRYTDENGTELFKIRNITKYEYGIEIWFVAEDYYNNLRSNYHLDAFREKLYHELQNHYGVKGRIVSRYINKKGESYY